MYEGLRARATDGMQQGVSLDFRQGSCSAGCVYITLRMGSQSLHNFYARHTALIQFCSAHAAKVETWSSRGSCAHSAQEAFLKATTLDHALRPFICQEEAKCAFRISYDLYRLERGPFILQRGSRSCPAMTSNNARWTFRWLLAFAICLMYINGATNGQFSGPLSHVKHTLLQVLLSSTLAMLLDMLRRCLRKRAGKTIFRSLLEGPCTLKPRISRISDSLSRRMDSSPHL